jgi:SpoIIAA-like
VPALRRALEAGGGLRALYLIEDLDEIEPGALWADTRLRFDLGVRHHDAWIRSAIVTDIDWMARATKLFAWMIPGEARVFPRDELVRAKTRGSRPTRSQEGDPSTSLTASSEVHATAGSPASGSRPMYAQRSAAPSGDALVGIRQRASELA